MEGNLTFGWYGKVPFLGDFVRAGLSPAFVGSWDSWLQGMLTRGREALQDRWDTCYLGAPIWRFALSQGACGPRAAIGVMMPSIDRVGRQFPLCLAAETDLPAAAAFGRLGPIFSEIEEIALAMLDDEASLAGLEQRLATLPQPDFSSAAMPDLEAENPAARHVHALAEAARSAPASLWVASLETGDRVLITPGMPADPDAVRLLFDLEAPYRQQTDQIEQEQPT